MIELVYLGIGVIIGFIFYGVYHLYPTKKDVMGNVKKVKMAEGSNKTFKLAHQNAVDEVRRLGLMGGEKET